MCLFNYEFLSTTYVNATGYLVRVCADKLSAEIVDSAVDGRSALCSGERVQSGRSLCYRGSNDKKRTVGLGRRHKERESIGRLLLTRNIAGNMLVHLHCGVGLHAYKLQESCVVTHHDGVAMGIDHAHLGFIGKIELGLGTILQGIEGGNGSHAASIRLLYATTPIDLLVVLHR